MAIVQIIDIGEDSQVPEDFTLQELNEGVWWRHLVAGGIAGWMSRTCTAPLDRLKVYLQVNFFTILYNLSVRNFLRLLKFCFNKKFYKIYLFL